MRAHNFTNTEGQSYCARCGTVVWWPVDASGRRVPQKDPVVVGPCIEEKP